MNEVIFVCDESGAKGFADKPEQAVKEIGIVAGVIVPKRDEVLVRNKMKAIAATCPASADGKLHITGLNEAAAEALRKEVFKLIKDHNLLCVYSATSVEGFHVSFQQRKAIETAAAAAKPAHIVDRNQRLKPERLYAELFQGALAVVVAYCMERYGKTTESSIHVRMDQVEETILKEFRATAGELINGSLGQTYNSEYYDTVAKKQLSFNVEVTVKGAGDYGPASHIKYTVQVDNDAAFTLLSDVVVNSLYDHIKKKFVAGKIDDLNGMDAVEGHELADSIYGLNQDGEMKRLSDMVHRHPSLKKPAKGTDARSEGISDSDRF